MSITSVVAASSRRRGDAACQELGLGLLLRFVVCATVVAGACEPATEHDQEAPSIPVRPTTPSNPSTWAYTCPDGLRFTVYYRDAEAQIDLPVRGLTLPSAVSASGARYASADTLFWDRGGEALLDVGGERHEECRGQEADSSEDAARILGYDFRGLGQEPGWLVDADSDRTIRWMGDYGEVRFATGAPEVEERSADTVVWSAATVEHEIRVTAVEEACRDSMSGRAFTHTVRVVVDGNEYAGCGRQLESGE